MYEYRKIYNVADEAGCEVSNDTTYEKNLERLTQVAAWIEREFGDIFEAKIDTMATPTCAIYVYFKGTRCGIFLQQTTSENQNTARGTVRDGSTKGNVETGSTCGYLAKNTVKLLVIKSKYGVIAGFFKDEIGKNVRAMAVNMGNRFVSVLSNAETQTYIADGSSAANVTALMRSGSSAKAFLTKLLPPTLDTVCDHAFLNAGASTTDCIVYSVGSDNRQFVELQGFANYVTFALELAEPSASDFAGITPIWS